MLVYFPCQPLPGEFLGTGSRSGISPAAVRMPELIDTADIMPAGLAAASADLLGVSLARLDVDEGEDVVHGGYQSFEDPPPENPESKEDELPLSEPQLP